MILESSLHDQVALLKLNDPARRNALSVDMVTALLEALRDTAREGARAVVIASALPTVFCSGADLKAIAGTGAGHPDFAPGTSPLDLFEALTRDPRPVIAAVSGAALGGGCELTLCCDIVLGSEDAWFAFPEIGHGRGPGTALARLPALIGARHARELILTRRRVDAGEAKALGLIHRVEQMEQLFENSIELAANLVRDTPPTALAIAKADLEAQLATDWAWVRATRARRDANELREGAEAFKAKRAPDYGRFWDAQLAQLAQAE